jgi:hypothetical protein
MKSPTTKTKIESLKKLWELIMIEHNKQKLQKLKS